MHQIENQIQRSIRHLAKKECANYETAAACRRIGPAM